MANPQHNIEALGDYVDHPIVEPNIERHCRMCVQKFGKYPGDDPASRLIESNDELDAYDSHP